MHDCAASQSVMKVISTNCLLFVLRVRYFNDNYSARRVEIMIMCIKDEVSDSKRYMRTSLPSF